MLSKRIKLLVVLVIVILVGVSFFGFILPELRPLPLASGSTLTYTLSGSVNNTTLNAPISGMYNFSISEFTKESYSYLGSGEFYSQALTLESPLPFYWKTTPRGMLVYYERISTPIGLKSVATYFEPSDDQLIMVQMGVESSVLYRLVVSSPDYHYEFALQSENQTNLAGYDNSAQLSEVRSMAHPIDQPQVFITDYGNDTGGRSFTYGSLEIREGERVKYDLSGNYSSALFFDKEDLKIIEGSGSFHYNESLSRQIGDPGLTDSMPDPGTYWFIIVMHATGSATTYWGI